MKTSLWTSLRSTISNLKERSSSLKKNKAIRNALSNKLNLNEEYQAAFRTNSYVEFTTTNNNKDNTSSSSLLSCLLEPDQDVFLQSCNNGGHVHHLLIEYFHASFEAFKSCQLLLQALHQTRINHAIIVNRVAKLTTTALMADDDDNCGLVYREDQLMLLSSFCQLKNPNFSILAHIDGQFLRLHESHSELLQKLTCKRNEIRRELRLKRIWKRAARGCFLISNAAVLVALLLLAFHSLIGIVAAPGLITCFVGLLKKKKRRDYKVVFSSEMVLRQMEIAARATYITMNDLDTLSRMAARLDVEVEHLRAVCEMYIRSSRRCEILKEFVVEDDAVVEQMKDLQQHIYLCLLTINRSRRLVMNEIMGDRDQSG
ncbi:UPF0496 protein At1g20180-like [Benincasa hispida]|uniref:UPF0496 protein At1g20180-like n=1 Tax=Benincasa hispida TaxID=102211 RepID=UPI001901BB4D|nr:UPF0496 protein At1g20180-like [Benincasa hispida]